MCMISHIRGRRGMRAAMRLFFCALFLAGDLTMLRFHNNSQFINITFSEDKIYGNDIQLHKKRCFEKLVCGEEWKYYKLLKMI